MDETMKKSHKIQLKSVANWVLTLNTHIINIWIVSQLKYITNMLLNFDSEIVMLNSCV